MVTIRKVKVFWGRSAKTTYRLSEDGKLIDSFHTLKRANAVKKLLTQKDNANGN